MYSRVLFSFSRQTQLKRYPVTARAINFYFCGFDVLNEDNNDQTPIIKITFITSKFIARI